MKLFLGIPSAGTPAQPFVESLSTVAFPPAVREFERTIVTGNFVPAQRDLIVQRALESGADVLIMCDDDLVLARDAFVLLCEALESHGDAAIAGALYYSRDGFRPMAVDRWDENDTRTATVPAFDRDPVSVDGVGFGCVAVRTTALRELMPPYFPAHVFVERGAGRVRVCDEDYLLCARMRRAGWRVLLHAGVRCGHYDRLNETILPEQWEPAEQTRQPRMAVIENGRYALVPVHDVAGSTAESRLTADVKYIIIP